MKCPFCHEHSSPEHFGDEIGYDRDGRYQMVYWRCGNTECSRLIVQFQEFEKSLVSKEGNLYNDRYKGYFSLAPKIFSVRPRGAMRPLPDEVPPEYSKMFQESCLVLDDSTNASAALSRRCLQYFINKELGIDEGNLKKDVQKTIDDKRLHPSVTDLLDDVRESGNNGAHAWENEVTGEIVDVEPEHASWMLDVLEDIFQVYFVVPATIAQRRKKWDESRKDVRKKPKPHSGVDDSKPENTDS